MVQNFFFFFFFFFVGGSLSPPRLNIFTVGNMGVMIYLGQGGLRSLSASCSLCDDPVECEQGIRIIVWQLQVLCAKYAAGCQSRDLTNRSRGQVWDLLAVFVSVLQDRGGMFSLSQGHLTCRTVP